MYTPWKDAHRLTPTLTKWIQLDLVIGRGEKKEKQEGEREGKGRRGMTRDGEKKESEREGGEGGWRERREGQREGKSDESD